MENQDAIDASIVNMLADPKEARAGIKEVHFLPFNPVEKRTAITYIDESGKLHRASKGAPEQIIDLCNMTKHAKHKVHKMIDQFADRGLRSLGVARQEVPEATKESEGAPWQFVGLLPLFDPPRHNSAETIRRALNLGVNVKMITGDQLAIGKETGRRLGMGTNMYPSTILLGDKNNELDIDELIEKADGFAGVFPVNKTCSYFIAGNCSYGERCKFVHSWFVGDNFSLLTPLQGHQKVVTGIALPLGSDKLYSGSQDEMVRVWDCQSGQCVGVINMGNEVGCMISEGPWIFIGITNSVKVWNTQTSTDLTLDGPVGQVYALVAGNEMLFAGAQVMNFPL
ncbi:uncharacterized protein A4U43_C10F9980 [Asparagus officinalis]|uniref:P-type H(+)-exporting transporter n=1 Tax=Asparagus officinalis TaxID=4686 RepID=A0A5P1E1Q5_ASPOF|nr:uncharacterized protein A4U43_C10F9980 [Asparagus officinalis]